MGVHIRYGSAGGELSGMFTQTQGRSPAALSVKFQPPVGGLPESGDVSISDGENTYTLYDFGLGSIQPTLSADGRRWEVQLFDHRRRWKYGHVSGHYNFGVPEGTEPDPGTDEWDARRNARELAEILLDRMEEYSYDVSALPRDAYPEVQWIYDNPAQMLDELAERYGCVVCYDHMEQSVTICLEGDGEDLPEGLLALSTDKTETPPGRPESLLGVCDPTEYEQWYILEAVGLDIDDEIKPIAELSYAPAQWDPPFMKSVAGGLAHNYAKATVFRWYRIASPQDVDGWKQGATLADLLPIGSELASVETVRASDGTVQTKRKEAVVRGMRMQDTGSAENSDADNEIEDGFQVNEEMGIVNLSKPESKLVGGVHQAADLQLRCVVYGDRHTEARLIGGESGEEVVRAEGLAVQYVDGVPQNKSDVEERVIEILEAKATSYETLDQGSARYSRIHHIPLDGRIRQVGWAVGPDGAFTEVSLNSEHDVTIPPAKVRRRIEKQAAVRFVNREGTR